MINRAYEWVAGMAEGVAKIVVGRGRLVETDMTEESLDRRAESAAASVTLSVAVLSSLPFRFPKAPSAMDDAASTRMVMLGTHVLDGVGLRRRRA